MDNSLFPYKSNQLILSSNRVHIHAKDDYAIVLGKKGVVLSTPKEVHINSNDGVFIDSNTIELGHEAKDLGENVVLGRTLVHHLTLFLKSLKSVGETLNSIKSKDSGGGGISADGISKIRLAGARIQSTCDQLEKIISLDDKLESKVLSKTTYTR